MVDWLFRDRRTGRIVIAQWPNLALAIWLGATALRAVLDPTGGWRTTLDLVATAALTWWSLDEILRGVNPWRRLLGTLVLTATALSLLH